MAFVNPIRPMRFIRITTTVLSLIAFAILIWFGGPLVAVGDSRPLEGVVIRIVVIAVVFAIVIGWMVFKRWRRNRKRRALEKGLIESDAPPDSDEGVLDERMREALGTLRRAGGRKGDILYDLPWYVIIGPPGAGKTTALVNSGLKFPLAERSGGVAAIAGTGGTRYCDWWFTDEAVLIDTAGRYTTQDSDASADRKSWLSFLDLLRTNRPRQPINGVLIAISVEDILGAKPEELAAHADAIRKRLAELHDRLKISFPVYAVFTKVDLIAGFMEYFSDLDEARRKVVWGATFQTRDRRANMVGEVGKEIDLLVERLAERMPERLQEEPDLRSRATLFGFPSQMLALKAPLTAFLNRIFEPTRFHANATLRGFYFTSGTQLGTPFDQIVGALTRSYGVESYGSGAYSGAGKSFFLHDLLRKVVFGEAGWVSTNMAAVRRAKLLRIAGFAAVAIASAAVLGAWAMSYSNNKALIAATQSELESYRASAGTFLAENVVDNTDLGPANELLQVLRLLPAGFEASQDGTPIDETFGLSQRARLESASNAAYQAALERYLRPRLLLRLEGEIQQNLNDAPAVFDPLRAYMMLGGLGPLDRAFVLDFFTRDWERTLPGAVFAESRAALRGHLEAMLQLDFGADHSAQTNGVLVSQAQTTVALWDLAERALAVMKAEATSFAIADWSLVANVDAAARAFETVDRRPLSEVTVPAFFTYDGFYNAFLARLGDVIDQLDRDKWVLGTAAQQAVVETQFANLLPNVIAAYSREFIAAWEGMLANLRFRAVASDDFTVLPTLISASSPLRQLLLEVQRETSLNDERPGGGANAAANAVNVAANTLTARIGGGVRFLVNAATAGATTGGSSGPAPGTAVHAHFAPIAMLAAGGIDPTLITLGDINTNLQAAIDPTNANRAAAAATVGSRTQQIAAAARTMPTGLSPMFVALASDLAAHATNTQRTQLSVALQTVTAQCQAITGMGTFYPFASGSSRDTPLSEFGALFRPNGILDGFFNTFLTPLVDRSGDVWTWRTDVPAAQGLSDAALAQFQRADEIRRAFFGGGSQTVTVPMNVRGTSVSGSVQAAALILGTSVVVVAGGEGGQERNFTWDPANTAVTLQVIATAEAGGGTATRQPTGEWALFRLIQGASAIPNGQRMSVSFNVGGRSVGYQFTINALGNPFTLAALREFRCPTVL